MSRRERVAILFGGRSTEHEISLLSAINIVSNLDRDKYEPILIAIDKQGAWHYQKDGLNLLNENDPKNIQLNVSSHLIVLSQNTNEHLVLSKNEISEEVKIDVIFPMLHGSFGEDGSIQGLARLANLPCVGPNILSSAIGIDKDIMKKVLLAEGIPTAAFATIRKNNIDDYRYSDLASKLGTELFVKPVSLGSSVGISHVKNEEEYLPALQKAFQFDKKVLIEKRIRGREIECAVLGNENPIASIPGEVIPKDGFYSYENKYIDEKGATLVAPAKLTPEEIKKIQKLAIQTFIALECTGMARVDMFLTSEGELLINEINTIPGFTKISMYPRLWELSGIPPQELITRLIELAKKENDQDNALIYAK